MSPVTQPLKQIPTDSLRRAGAKWLLGYWSNKVESPGLPRAEAVLLNELPSIATNLMVLDPTGKPGELRYRTVGPSVNARFGMDLTGRTLSLDSSGGWAAAFLEAISRRHPVALRGRIAGGDPHWGSFEAVVLPVASTAPGGVSLVAGMFFDD